MTEDEILENLLLRHHGLFLQHDVCNQLIKSGYFIDEGAKLTVKGKEVLSKFYEDYKEKAIKALKSCRDNTTNMKYLANTIGISDQ